MTKRFDALRAQIDADPVRREHVEQYKRAMLDATDLAEIREAHQSHRGASGDSSTVPQPEVARVERQEDLYLRTLGEYVAELGGRLEVRAVFPDQTIRLVGAEERQPVEG